ncbi:flavin reductase [Micromonospora vinacea]|uniref:flavin reductase n=1 Tax=Micromonospora TaxID=1873 RepID=UPI003862FBC9|nr:flavin reductase [Micromonospora sp. NBC_00860]WTA64509.1 flavin reductase [Micromonospora sp. NBC_00855]
MPERPKHSPLRPSWRCPVCGILWPCSAAKLRLLGEYRRDRPGLLIHLAKVQETAEVDLAKLNPDVALPDLTPRFVGWAETR